MKQIKDRVLEMLETHKHLRDHDEKLIAHIWYECYTAKGEKIGMNFDASERAGVLKFLQLFAKRKLPNIKTIIRYRAKLQEENKELRGVKYKSRHALSDFWKTEYGRV